MKLDGDESGTVVNCCGDRRRCGVKTEADVVSWQAGSRRLW